MSYIFYHKMGERSCCQVLKNQLVNSLIKFESKSTVVSVEYILLLCRSVLAVTNFLDDFLDANHSTDRCLKQKDEYSFVPQKTFVEEEGRGIREINHYAFASLRSASLLCHSQIRILLPCAKVFQR